MSSHWLCAQLGAREHYAIARVLHRSGNLNTLMTDAWVRPGSAFAAIQRNLAERYHPDLAVASIKAWNASLLTFELAARAGRLTGWPLIMKRNCWFQGQIIKALSSLPAGKSPPPVLFGYSYASLEPFRFARKRGWKTVLGQIDPGPAEERLVQKLHLQHGEIKSHGVPAPEEYWRLWREECTLADRIIVNSSWSRTALVNEGIEAEKITVVPLALDTPAAAADFQRSYPETFTLERPLRVLFLGQVNLRKGMAEVFGAIRLLQDSPIEFSIVGPAQLEIPLDMRSNARVRWKGPATRNSVSNHYRQADVFLFPTHSDGFGLTQLEAQAWKLPIIASPFCGTVVEEGRNGWLLPEVSAEAIAKQLLECVCQPELLRAAAARSGIASCHTFASIGASLSRLGSM